MVSAETGSRGTEARTASVSGGLIANNQSKPLARWTPSDAIAAAGLFLATAGVILWQNAHVVVLWDFSYVLDSAVRMACGQMPYRDFPFVHAPLTFLIQAAIIHLTGCVFFHHALYAAVVGGLGTVLAWRIALDTLRGPVVAAWPIALLLAAPLAVVGIYCILPLPSYDCDCAFSILVAVWLLRRLERRQGRWSGFAAGAACCVPLFFKQNMGLPFLLAVLCAIALLIGARAFGPARTEFDCPDASTLLALVTGACATLLAAALLLHFTAGIGNYIYWTIRFAAQRRLPGLGAMLGVYLDPGLLWTLPCVTAALFVLRFGGCAQLAFHPSRESNDAARVGHRGRPARARWAQVTAFALLATPFVFTFSSLLLHDDADERGDSLLALWPLLLILAAAPAAIHLIRRCRSLIRRCRSISLPTLLPLILLAAIHGAFLSQQLWGSTYAIWPLLIVLVAELIVFLAGVAPPSFVYALAALISATLLLCGGFYTASEERLSYAQFPSAPVEHSASPQLAGMATPGPYLSGFDELLRYAAANIPVNDGLILIPGEDPFYFATGRVPQFPLLLFDPATDPYSPHEVAQLVQARNIRWLIVKRGLQIKEDPTPQRAELMQALMGEFALAARLRGYDVYRR
jgi:hypothetical protein